MPSECDRYARAPSLIAVALAVCASLLPGCVSNGVQGVATRETSSQQSSHRHGCDRAKDRAAIRAMAGTFAVTFEFEETVALSPGYEPRKPYSAVATEVIEIIEENDSRIVLQHILLLPSSEGPSTPLKHWRQDWTFEDQSLLEFRGQRVWQHRKLSDAEAHCTWSQAVYQVDDGPRYESYGHWSHAKDGSAWTSQETWRPLPRREHTKRNDYDVLIGSNRHVVTADGWTHEQDNRKWVTERGAALVRERGLNRYKRTKLDSAAVANAYLRDTGAFWADVRTTWSSLLDQAQTIIVHLELEGKPLYERLFPLAKEIGTLPADERRKRILEIMKPYVEVSQTPKSSN